MKRLPIILGVVLWCAPLHAAEPTVDYLKHVKPLLTTKCVSCHGALKQESGLRLDASSLILKGGDSGQAVVAGKSSSSLLIQRVSSNDEDERMPPTEEGDHLTAEQIELLARWIDDGANAPREEVPPDPRSHWAFQPISRPAIPTPTNKAWVRNDIDALIAVEHERSGLKPAPATSKELLLRRLYLDLVGLPPTQLELHAFLNDSSPQAFEHVVDRLLDSPQYGERWGRHWMDVWRYSDWAGFGNEIRYSQRHVWRWRDWIIESLNEDKGYDQMVVEMLAADEAAPADENAVRATGFLARNWYKFDRNVWLDDVVEHSGKAFLGMTFKCARCHDHKYDPISQMEYYRLRAIFEPYDVRTDGVAGEPDVTKNGLARVYDATADAKTYFFKRGDPKQADREHPLEPNVPSVIAGEFNVQPIELSVQSYYPAIQINITRDLQARAETAVEAAEKNLQSARQQLADFQDPQDDPAVQDKPQEPPTPNVATPNVPAPADSTPLTDKPEVVFLDDDFAKNDLKAWKSIRGQWEAVDGHLEQKQIVSTFSPLVTVGNHPSDFAASMEFKPTGGNVYRSVGFSFDWVADRDFQAVYLSAKDGASTVSAFHRRNGADAYPANAVVPHPIKVGQRAKLEVLVRGDLLNLKVDGQLKLAYRLPVPRQQGKFAIWTYDAAA
ncbi:MAG: mono/diheme cytochrome c family protein, partial [Pirellulaceae bacterium]